MIWKDKKYKAKTICCSTETVPILKDKWMYCPKCGEPKSRNWLTKNKIVSGWLRAFAWWPTRVAGFWIWLEHFEYCASVTGVNSSAGGFEMYDIEYKRLVPDPLRVEVGV